MTVCSVRSPWKPPDLPNFNLNCQKISFCEKVDFSVFGPIGLHFGVLFLLPGLFWLLWVATWDGSCSLAASGRRRGCRSAGVPITAHWPKTGHNGSYRPKNWSYRAKKLKNRLFHKNCFFDNSGWNWGGLEVSRVTAPSIRSYMQFFSRFGLTWHRKVNFSTFSGKLTFQSSRNGPQNLPFCPGSLQDTFIILSSISHQHNFRKYV